MGAWVNGWMDGWSKLRYYRIEVATVQSKHILKTLLEGKG